MHAIRHFFSIFFSESIGNALRGSFLFAAVMLVMSSSGIWKYLGSTITAHELVRSAAWSVDRESEHLPLVIAVDDSGYQNLFNTRSPLPRDRMLLLLQTIAAHTRSTARVSIDIDLSPAPGQETQQAALDAFLLQNPARWVLPAVRAGNPELAVQLRNWRLAMCARGIGFGLPYIPTEFGYPKLTYQYRNSLGDASRGTNKCPDPEIPFIQKPLPLQPQFLKTGTVVPFSGDLEALASILDTINPESVVLGGAWGNNDIFATPFGDRYGVQIHAAALAGIIQGERLVPSFIELLLSLAVVSLISTSLFYAVHSLNRYATSSIPSMVGHSFFTARLKPVLLIAMVLVMLFLMMEMLAILHARTGIWVDTAQFGGYTIVCLLVDWNLGRSAPAHFQNWTATFHSSVVSPLMDDLRSISQSLRVVFKQSSVWTEAGQQIVISRLRALFEGVCAFLSLMMQSVVPIGSMAYIVYKSV